MPATLAGCRPAPRETAGIVLTEDEAAGAPYAASDGRVAKDADAIAATLAANPVAGVTLALLLRTSARLDVPAAVVAESAAYSALQEGADGFGDGVGDVPHSTNGHRRSSGHQPGREAAWRPADPEGTQILLPCEVVTAP